MWVLALGPDLLYQGRRLEGLGGDKGHEWRRWRSKPKKKKKDDDDCFVLIDFVFRPSCSRSLFFRLSNARLTEGERAGNVCEVASTATQNGDRERERERWWCFFPLFFFFPLESGASRSHFQSRSYFQSISLFSSHNHACRRPLLRPRPRLRGRGLRYGLVPAQTHRHGEAAGAERGSSGGCLKVVSTVGRASDAGQSPAGLRRRRPAGAPDPRPV